MIRGLVALLALVSAVPASEATTQVRYVMGTLYTVEAEGPQAKDAVEAAFAELHRLDASLSTYKADSELSQVNRQAGHGWTPVSAETAGLVSKALSLAEETGGAFDPTVGPLVSLWGFKHLDYHVPTDAAIHDAMQHVGWRYLAVDRVHPAVSLAKPGMAIDLGATAKGYAVDRAIALLKSRGMTRARVDAGGNQGVWGKPTDHWTFGVKHPRQEGDVLGMIRLSGGGIATAGDAERGFWKDGVRYGHILNPATGRPATGMLSVTVVAPTAEEADALDTPLYVLGVEKGRKLLERHPGCEALFVEAGDHPGTYHLTATPGLRFTPDTP